MAWRQVSQGAVKYHVNLEQVAYLQEAGQRTLIQFAAVAETRGLSLQVDQSAAEILREELDLPPSR